MSHVGYFGGAVYGPSGYLVDYHASPNADDIIDSIIEKFETTYQDVCAGLVYGHFERWDKDIDVNRNHITYSHYENGLSILSVCYNRVFTVLILPIEECDGILNTLLDGKHHKIDLGWLSFTAGRVKEYHEQT